ncbi:MAG: hypothetical protein Q7U87_04665, partial [bacterium]|nr:hypothetical protein [bacterium]
NQGISVKKFLDNEYVGLHYNLGLAHEQLGNRQKALDEYEQVYILDINYKDVSQRMRNLLENSGQPQPQTGAPPKPSEPAGVSGEEPAAEFPAPEEMTVPGEWSAEAMEPAEMVPATAREAREESELEEDYQDLTAFQAQTEESPAPEIPGLDEEVQAEEAFSDDTVEVIMDRPPRPAPQTEPGQPSRTAPVKSPDDEPYLGSNQQGLSFL